MYPEEISLNLGGIFYKSYEVEGWVIYANNEKTEAVCVGETDTTDLMVGYTSDKDIVEGNGNVAEMLNESLGCMNTDGRAMLESGEIIDFMQIDRFDLN